jgi:anti-sigma factor RsiW
MTDCPNGEIRDQLPDYVHGRLDAGERARVAAHVATCAACAAEVALLETTRRLQTAAAPRIDTARIARALPSPPVRVARRRASSRLASWRIAAAIATVAIGGASIAVIRGITTPAGDRMPSAQPVAVVAPAEPTESSVALPDAGHLSDLSDDDVESLLNDIEHFDGVPDADPQPAVPTLHSGGSL